MNQTNPKQSRVLGIAPSTRGFGFAILQDEGNLADWGIKTVKGDKNRQSLAKVKELIDHYQPDALALEDASAKGSRRLPRIRKLCEQIIKLAAARKVKIKVYSRDLVLNTFIADEPKTKQVLAQTIAGMFPEQLMRELPPKRKPWMSEDARMSIFEAGALALVLMLKETKRMD